MENIKDILKRFVNENITDEDKRKKLLEACEVKSKETEKLEENK